MTLGSVTPWRGKFLARAPNAMGRKLLGSFGTPEAAQRAILEYMQTHSQGQRVRGRLFGAFASHVLDLRESDGVRGIRTERSRFRAHVETSELADMLVDEINSADVANFVRKLYKTAAQDDREARKLSRRTVQRVFALVSAIFNEAVIQNKRPNNPCMGVRVRRREDEAANADPWDYLQPAEMVSVLRCEEIPEWARLMLRFAWGTGLRQGEQWNLELPDLHLGPAACTHKECKSRRADPHVIVRFGSKGLPPKSGKVRRVPLFGEGLAAARAWVKALPLFAPENPDALAFPFPSGKRRPVGAPERSVRVEGRPHPMKEELLPIWFAAAGVDRPMRWHDLRHTCGTALVNGFWGRRWSLQEACEMLGHSSVAVTEKYAHVDEDALADAAAETGNNLVTARPAKRSQPSKTASKKPEKRTHVRDGLKAHGAHEQDHIVTPEITNVLPAWLETTKMGVP